MMPRTIPWPKQKFGLMGGAVRLASCCSTCFSGQACCWGYRIFSAAELVTSLNQVQCCWLSQTCCSMYLQASTAVEMTHVACQMLLVHFAGGFCLCVMLVHGCDLLQHCMCIIDPPLLQQALPLQWLCAHSMAVGRASLREACRNDQSLS